LANWNTRAEAFYRSRPTGVSDIRAEAMTNHANDVKLASIRATAHARTGVAAGRHADTRAFYTLIDNAIPANIAVYQIAGAAQNLKLAITNHLKTHIANINAFHLA
jgi:hypothetical protein